MADDNANIPTPTERERNPWRLPAMTLWGFAPAMLMMTFILNRDGVDGIVTLLWQANLLGMPIVLFGWSVVVLRTYGRRRSTAMAALLGIPLSIAMCVANLAVAFAGCSILYRVFPVDYTL